MENRTLIAKITLIALIIAVMGGTSMAFGQEIRQIHVRGHGTIKVEPDLAHISLGVVTQAEVAEEAQAQNALNMRNILVALEKLGIEGEDIETSYFNVYPNYRYDQEKGDRLVGYRVSNTISVSLKDLSLVGEVIDRAIAAGATNVNNVHFTVRDEEPWLDKALTAAVQDGRRKAQIMAAAAGEELGLIMLIRDPSTNLEPYLAKDQMVYRAALAESGAPTYIQPGKLDISASVEMIFAVK